MIKQEMIGVLNNAQMAYLESTLYGAFKNVEVVEKEQKQIEIEPDFLHMFLAAKQVEGCSARTLKYYKSTLDRLIITIQVPVREMTTDHIREYLSSYGKEHVVCKLTIDNVRRIISSFFSWLEDENHILKSPARRIHKIRTGKTVKMIYSDEELEDMRDACENIRDLAMIDLLASTGIRVSELTGLNIADVNFDERECLVTGKGNKQRLVYFDARTKIHLKNYLKMRVDSQEALFVSLKYPFYRLQTRGVELRLQKLGQALSIDRVHPHKFRRTLATKAIEKGMPIEQVQVLLGHSKIDTTLQYAMVNQNSVKLAHQKYIG